MALPLPRVVYDVEPGGGILTSMKGGNALTRSNLENEAKQIENEYLPLKTKAQAASQLAYSNLAGPQFVSKLFGNDFIYANVPEAQRKEITAGLIKSGMSPQAANNVFNNMPSSSQSSRNPLGNGLLGLLANIFTGNRSNQQQSSFQMPMQQQQSSNPAQIPGTPQSQDNQEYGAVNKATPQEVDYYANHGNSSLQNQTGSTQTTPTQSIPYEPTTAENVANFRSIIKQGEAEGTQRGKDIADIGKEQLALSNSGVILDRLTDIIQNPTFNSMRSEIPFFQDKQLSFLAKTGKKEQQDLIGDFISTAQAFKASTVNSFKGKALEKEFNLADKIKIDENDTMGVAEGKLRSLKTLKEIAEAKNNIILDLMGNPRHLNLGQAIREANKMIDIKSIEKEVNDLLKPKTTIMYKNNQTYHIPNNRVQAAKEKGYTDVR